MTNLTDKVHALSEFEKVFLIRCINETGAGEMIHLGKLPFVNLDYACSCLTAKIPVNDAKTPESRYAKKVLEKLRGGSNHVTTFTIRLDDQKVFRRSRGDGLKERVMMLPGFRKTEAGIQYNYFKREYQRVPSSHRLQAVMTRTSPGVWQVEVDSRYMAVAKSHIFTLCGHSIDEWSTGLKVRRK